MLIVCDTCLLGLRAREREKPNILGYTGHEETTGAVVTQNLDLLISAERREPFQLHSFESLLDCQAILTIPLFIGVKICTVRVPKGYRYANFSGNRPVVISGNLD